MSKSLSNPSGPKIMRNRAIVIWRCLVRDELLKLTWSGRDEQSQKIDDDECHSQHFWLYVNNNSEKTSWFWSCRVAMYSRCCSGDSSVRLSETVESRDLYKSAVVPMTLWPAARVSNVSLLCTAMTTTGRKEESGEKVSFWQREKVGERTTCGCAHRRQFPGFSSLSFTPCDEYREFLPKT